MVTTPRSLPCERTSRMRQGAIDFDADFASLPPGNDVPLVQEDV